MLQKSLRDEKRNRIDYSFTVIVYCVSACQTEVSYYLQTQWKDVAASCEGRDDVLIT